MCVSNREKCSTSEESHSTVPREGNVHHGGPGAPSLAQPGRDEGRRQGTLSRRPGDTVEGFTQQFSAVQQQTEAIQHILLWHDVPSTAAPGARPQSARRRGRPSASSRAESTPRPALQASRRRAAPPRIPARRRGESIVLFRRWSKGQRYPLLKKEKFPFPPGSQVHGMTVCDALLPHSRPQPTFASSQESTVRGRCTSPRTSGQSRLGPREFVEDASERTAFCTIHPYSLSLHHYRYFDCAVGAACTVSGGVAHTAQPVTRTIRLGYAIQLARRPPKFNGVLETLVAVRNAPVL